MNSKTSSEVLQVLPCRPAHRCRFQPVQPAQRSQPGPETERKSWAPAARTAERRENEGRDFTHKHAVTKAPPRTWSISLKSFLSAQRFLQEGNFPNVLRHKSSQNWTFYVVCKTCFMKRPINVWMKLDKCFLQVTIFKWLRKFHLNTSEDSSYSISTILSPFQSIRSSISLSIGEN